MIRPGIEIKDAETLNISFAHSNKFMKHVNQHTKTLCFSVLIYLFFSATIILLFMWVFGLQSCSDALGKSVKAYFGVEYPTDISQQVIICEIITRDLFSILVVGVTISNIMVPQNPIEIAELHTNQR